MGEYPFCRSVPNCGMGIGIRPWQIRRIKCYSLPINLSSWSALQRIHFDSRAVSQLVGIVICSKWPCDLAHPVIRRNVAQCHSRRRWLGESDHRTTQLRRSWCVRLEILTSRTSRHRDRIRIRLLARLLAPPKNLVAPRKAVRLNI